MINSVLDFLSKYVDLDINEIHAVTDSIIISTYKKGTILLKEGEISKFSFFNIEGCVRSYSLHEGEEKTTYFYTENQFITSYKSFTKQIPSKHFLQCIEDCTLGILSYESEKKLLSLSPKFEFLSRMILEEELGSYQDILSAYITEKPEVRYKNLLDLKPNLVQRIPQYQLASYLGVTPESLSRIRKRITHQ